MKKATYVVLAIALVYLAWVFIGRYESNRRIENAAAVKKSVPYRDLYGIDDTGRVKILQFYANRGTLEEGENLAVCYGVVNARSVRLEPGGASLSPSPNRCVEAAPDESTRYTLVAEGHDGRPVTASFEVQVQPDPDRHPRIVYFRAGRKAIDRGRTVYLLCYETQAADEIQLDPDVVPLRAAFRGCFYVSPERTTTYKLTAKGYKGRQAQKELTATVD